MDHPCEVTVKRLTRHVHSDWLLDTGCCLLKHYPGPPLPLEAKLWYNPRPERCHGKR